MRDTAERVQHGVAWHGVACVRRIKWDDWLAGYGVEREGWMKTVCLVIINASVTVAATALDLPTPKPPANTDRLVLAAPPVGKG